MWAWLETRPWVTRGTYGVYPHDLVRDVLDADLRRRSPATYRRVHRTVHEHAWTALKSPDEGERRLWAHQKLFLHRRSPLAVSFWTMRTRGTGMVAPADRRAPSGGARMRRAARGRGERAARRALARGTAREPLRRSLGLRGRGVRAARDASRRPRARRRRPGDRGRRSTSSHGPPLPGRASRSASAGSSAASSRTSATRTPSWSRLACSSTVLWTTRPLAWSFVATTDPEFWGPVFHYLGLTTRADGRLRRARTTRCTASTGAACRPTGGSSCSAERELTGESGPGACAPAAPATALAGPVRGVAARRAARPPPTRSPPDERPDGLPAGDGPRRGVAGAAAHDAARGHRPRRPGSRGARRWAGCSTARTCTPRPPRRPRRRCWTCRSRPTAGTWPAPRND